MSHAIKKVPYRTEIVSITALARVSKVLVSLSPTFYKFLQELAATDYMNRKNSSIVNIQ